MKGFLSVVCLVLATGVSAQPALRLMTLGGAVSETVCALGACDSIVATDSSSLYPAKLSSLPQLGYMRALNAEGILAQKADLILCTPQAGPDSVLDRVKASGVNLRRVDGGITVEAARSRITELGSILNRKVEASLLLKDLDHDLKNLQQERQKIQKAPTVLFIYARGSKVLQIAGKNTAAATMIELAGAVNAFSQFQDYKPLTPEAVVAAAPDLVLLTKDGLTSLGGSEGLWQLPGLQKTPAFAHKRLVVMEDLFLLGMGPRLGKAALALMNEVQRSMK